MTIKLVPDALSTEEIDRFKLEQSEIFAELNELRLKTTSERLRSALKKAMEFPFKEERLRQAVLQTGKPGIILPTLREIDAREKEWNPLIREEANEAK